MGQISSTFKEGMYNVHSSHIAARAAIRVRCLQLCAVVLASAASIQRLSLVLYRGFSRFYSEEMMKETEKIFLFELFMFYVLSL